MSPTTITLDWGRIRRTIPILVGVVLLIYGAATHDAVILTVGGGLVGFTPAAKGPTTNGSAEG